ncbi:MAG: glycosyltransferase [Chloroflexota bacterium]
MWQALVAYFVLVAARVWLNNRSLRNYLKLPLVERPTQAGELPSVSIVIPARNEAHNLPALLASLNALEPPAAEVIVVDDGSSDATAKVAQEHGATLIHIDGPPPGWQGKTFACWTGARQATCEWLMFTDADTVHEPASLNEALRFARQHNAQAVSMFLQQRCVTFWERVLLPYAYQQYFVGVPYRRVNDPRDPAALANGQYILVQREAYVRAGGHEAVKEAIVDDVALAARLKAAGVRLLIVRGERLASVRMYRRLGDIWTGFGKNAYGFLRQRGAGGLLTVLATILSGLAIPCAIYGLAAGDRAFELAALVTYVSAVAELSLWQFLFGTSLSYAIFQPLAMVVFLAIALDSAVRRKHVWKGRLV